MPSVTVFLPVHNEAWLIGSVLGQITDFARSHRNWRFVILDDGSTDDTAKRITEHLQDNTACGIELLPLTPNRGKASALREAMLGADEELLLFTDGDLAYPLEHLDRLVDALEDADIAIGSRALAIGPQTNITATRRFIGTTFNHVVRLMTGMSHEDTQAGLKGFRRLAAHTLFQAQVTKDFSFDVELLYLAHRFGFRVAEIPANISQRHSYKKSNVNMLRDPLRMFASVLRMRRAHRNRIYDRPTEVESTQPPLITIEPRPAVAPSRVPVQH